MYNENQVSTFCLMVFSSVDLVRGSLGKKIQDLMKNFFLFNSPFKVCTTWKPFINQTFSWLKLLISCSAEVKRCCHGRSMKLLMPDESKLAQCWWLWGCTMVVQYSDNYMLEENLALDDGTFRVFVYIIMISQTSFFASFMSFLRETNSYQKFSFNWIHNRQETRMLKIV